MKNCGIKSATNSILLILILFSISGYAQRYKPFSKEEMSTILDLEKESRLAFVAIEVKTLPDTGCKKYLFSSFDDLYSMFFKSIEYADFVDSIKNMINNDIVLDLTSNPIDSIQIYTVCDNELRKKDSDKLINSIFQINRLIKEKYYDPPPEIARLLFIENHMMAG